MKKISVFLFLAVLLLLPGCKSDPAPIAPAPSAQEVTEPPTPSQATQTAEPTPSDFPTAAPTQTPQPEPTPAATLSPAVTTAPQPTADPTPSEEPIDYDALYRQEGLAATVEGFYHRPFEELPQALRDSLTWDGQIRTEQGYRFRLRRYVGPNIVITTTEARDDALQDWLDWESANLEDGESRAEEEAALRAEYELEKGREWLYSVTITDDSYSTVLGLKVGNTVEEAEALGYPVRERLNADGTAFFGNTWEHNMCLRVEDNVIKHLDLYWGIGRYCGKYWDL